MTERNAYTGRFRKAGAVPAGKLSPEAEAEIERLWENLYGRQVVYLAQESEFSDALRAAMLWAFKRAEAIAWRESADWAPGPLDGRCDSVGYKAACDIENAIKKEYGGA